MTPREDARSRAATRRFEPEARAQPADHQAGGHRAAAQAAHQQAEAGRAQRRAGAAPITGSSAHSAEPAAL